MEPSILFAQLVLGMCAIHVVSQSSEYIAKWRAKNRSGQGSSQKSAKKNIRDDWYVFFCCSDLWGKDSGKKLDQTQKTADKAKTRRDTRPVARV